MREHAGSQLDLINGFLIEVHELGAQAAYELVDVLRIVERLCPRRDHSVVNDLVPELQNILDAFGLVRWHERLPRPSEVQKSERAKFALALFRDELPGARDLGFGHAERVKQYTDPEFEEPL